MSIATSIKVERPSNLALGAGKQKTRVSFNEDSISSSRKTSASECITSTPSPRKLRFEPEFRSRRKRTHSWSFSWDHINNKRRRSAIVLPSKFLLGGNITDPLNLEALDKEDVTKNDDENLNGSLRRGGGTVKVIIPPNINDPLNLDACSEDGDELLADAIFKQRRRRKPRKRKRRNSEPSGASCDSDLERRLSTSWEEDVADIEPLKPLDLKNFPLPSTSSFKEKVPLLSTKTFIFERQMSEPPLPVFREIKEPPSSAFQSQQQIQAPQTSQINNRTTGIKKLRPKGDDKIVSPVVPQPGVERKRHSSHQRHFAEKPPNLGPNIQPRNVNIQPPKNFNPKNHMFQYGNYNQYYGYRNPDHRLDPRLKHMSREWFEGKEVLDIGCNIGHITLSIARSFGPQMVVGMDIDKKLINIAKKNIKHYIHSNTMAESEYPKSMRLLYGPMKPPVNRNGRRTFPHNVTFYQGNYVLENEALLETIRPDFDVILCLSVTKWVHLNWGDCGLKKFFKRIYRNLRPQGILILEPQGWPSYTKKRKVTPEIFENYKSIKLYPEKFGEYLTKEVGFTYVKKLAFAHHSSKGFQRPILVYRKDVLDRKSKELSEVKGEKVDAASENALPFGEEEKKAPCESIKLTNNPGLEVISQPQQSAIDHLTASITTSCTDVTTNVTRGTKRLLDSCETPANIGEGTLERDMKRTKCDKTENEFCENENLKLDNRVDVTKVKCSTEESGVKGYELVKGGGECKANLAIETENKEDSKVKIDINIKSLALMKMDTHGKIRREDKRRKSF